MHLDTGNIHWIGAHGDAGTVAGHEEVTGIDRTAAGINANFDPARGRDLGL